MRSECRIMENMNAKKIDLPLIMTLITVHIFNLDS